ncbi:MAG TPA: MFS transporter, partial [Candidatus Sulfotelmatobacter sp.]|nr:MFS transporter [Candidatus Sulfotelmatobacter sp.]
METRGRPGSQGAVDGNQGNSGALSRLVGKWKAAANFSLRRRVRLIRLGGMQKPLAANPPSPNPARASAQRPSHARYWVIVFAVSLAIIQYIDRVCISQAAPLIQADLRLSAEQMGWVFSAFTLAYALFEIPAGYLGDRIGPRKVLLRIVLWWSFFTVATGWMRNLGSMVVTRFLFGAGEAGAFPNLTKAFNRWLPLQERT